VNIAGSNVDDTRLLPKLRKKEPDNCCNQAITLIDPKSRSPNFPDNPFAKCADPKSPERAQPTHPTYSDQRRCPTPSEAIPVCSSGFCFGRTTSEVEPKSRSSAQLSPASARIAQIHLVQPEAAPRLYRWPSLCCRVCAAYAK